MMRMLNNENCHTLVVWLYISRNCGKLYKLLVSSIYLPIFASPGTCTIVSELLMHMTLKSMNPKFSSIFLSLFVCVCVCVCVEIYKLWKRSVKILTVRLFLFIYLFVYWERERERGRARAHEPGMGRNRDRES